MIVVCEKQHTAEWYAARLGLATGSHFADIMTTVKTGESAARAAYRTNLVIERLTNRPTEYFVNAAMRQGSEREPLARQAYQEATFEDVQETGFIRHDTLECGVSPDGLIGNDGGLEIKCPERAAHYVVLKSRELPGKYKWQVQGSMWITGRSQWDFVSWNPDFPHHLQLFIFRVSRDEDAIKLLEAGVKKFMEEVRNEENQVKGAK